MNTEFKVGEYATLLNATGYPQLTEGHIYSILDYEPEYHDPTSSSGYTWPAYVTVQAENGKMCTLHASRFAHVEE